MRPEDARIGDLVSGTRRHQRGRDDGAGLVAHRQQPGAHRRCHRRTARGRYPRGLCIRRRGARSGESVPQDIRRLRKQHFSSDDQLLTLALAGGMSAKRLGGGARSQGARSRCTPAATLAGLAKALGPDVTYIHCTHVHRAARGSASPDSGGHVSIACSDRDGDGPRDAADSAGARSRHPAEPQRGRRERRCPAISSRRCARCSRCSGCRRWRARARRGTTRPVADRHATWSSLRRSPARAPTGSIAKIGTLTPGKEADVIVLRTGHDQRACRSTTPTARWCWAMDTSNVDTVFIARHDRASSGGRLVGVDLGARRPRRRSVARLHRREGRLEEVARFAVTRYPASSLNRSGSHRQDAVPCVRNSNCAVTVATVSVFASALSDPISEDAKVEEVNPHQFLGQVCRHERDEPFFSFDSSLFP